MGDRSAAGGGNRKDILGQVPNALSIGRIAAAPLLFALAWTRHETAYAVLLAAALLSDVVDGWLARALGVQSPRGAKLDSIGDVLMLASAAYGIAVFHPKVYLEHATGCGIVLGGWILVGVLALPRYGRLPSFHTYASKAAGCLLAVFICALFLSGFHPWLFRAAVAVSAFASAEELLLLRWLPGWRTDVRGAWWIRKERRG
ncbi:MAG TPA: CDP-alcohol phosphatidyltransferase family protein [Lysobacter sp.]|nr:CDP-alcohol phosphatidyltransferase family protein [Lysobacter sp.]